MSTPLAYLHNDKFPAQSLDVSLLDQSVVFNLRAGNIRPTCPETRAGAGMPITSVELVHGPRCVADAVNEQPVLPHGILSAVVSALNVDSFAVLYITQPALGDVLKDVCSIAKLCFSNPQTRCPVDIRCSMHHRYKELAPNPKTCKHLCPEAEGLSSMTFVF